MSDAITHYIALRQDAEDKDYTVTYLADIEKCLGDCRSSLKEYDKAVQHYEASLRHNNEDLTKVFFAKAQANLGNLKSARETLRSIEISRFNELEHYDFAIAWAILATLSHEKDDLETAKLNLKKAKSFWPFFVTKKDSALIDLLETSPNMADGKLKNLIKMLNRYVSLNPNLFGIGVNLNKIIEDVQTKKIHELSNKTSEGDVQ